MLRLLPITALLGATTMLLASGCSRTPANYEVFLEVTGAAAAREVTYTTSNGHTPEENVKLPWKIGLVIEDGSVAVRAVPTKGAVTCSIVVEGKKVAERTGKDGEAVECRKVIREKRAA